MQLNMQYFMQLKSLQIMVIYGSESRSAVQHRSNTKLTLRLTIRQFLTTEPDTSFYFGLKQIRIRRLGRTEPIPRRFKQTNRKDQ
jgi:hypothetical protein